MQMTRVLYAGRVQGVGFRFQVLRLSRRFAVVGHVRNLGDGTVELLVHGSPDEVARFREAIRAALEGFIRGESASAVEAEAFSGFDIAY